MKNEKMLNKSQASPQEMTDEEMNQVVGGANTCSVFIRSVQRNGGIESTYANYEWRGSDDNMKYLCPKCNRPVHLGAGWRYYCDPCDESWFVESNLKMNPSGGWVFTNESTKWVDNEPYIPGTC